MARDQRQCPPESHTDGTPAGTYTPPIPWHSLNGEEVPDDTFFKKVYYDKDGGVTRGLKIKEDEMKSTDM